jgi:hypothetical protein
LDLGLVEAASLTAGPGYDRMYLERNKYEKSRYSRLCKTNHCDQ